MSEIVSVIVKGNDFVRPRYRLSSWGFILLLPFVAPLLLLLISVVFPTPPPGPWPYGQPTLLVEELIAITLIVHLFFSLHALIYSLWGIHRSEWQMAYWLLVLFMLPTLLVLGVELSMTKSGKWM